MIVSTSIIPTWVEIILLAAVATVFLVWLGRKIFVTVIKDTIQPIEVERQYYGVGKFYYAFLGASTVLLLTSLFSLIPTDKNWFAKGQDLNNFLIIIILNVMILTFNVFYNFLSKNWDDVEVEIWRGNKANNGRSDKENRRDAKIRFYLVKGGLIFFNVVLFAILVSNLMFK